MRPRSAPRAPISSIRYLLPLVALAALGAWWIAPEKDPPARSVRLAPEPAVAAISLTAHTPGAAGADVERVERGLIGRAMHQQDVSVLVLAELNGLARTHVDALEVVCGVSLLKGRLEDSHEA